MKLPTLVLAFVAASAFGADHPGANEPVQSQASYEAAIHNHSTSPSYVLITVVDDRTAKARPVCTGANFLLGALHREHGFEYDAAGASRADEMALANKTHVFHFTKQEALENIPVRYSEAELAAARALLAPLSDTELSTTFSSLYPGRRSAFDHVQRDAIACALLERGLSPQQADRSGQVVVPAGAGAQANRLH